MGLLPEQAAVVDRFARKTRLVIGIVFRAKQYSSNLETGEGFGLTVERSWWAPCLISAPLDHGRGRYIAAFPVGSYFCAHQNASPIEGGTLENPTPTELGCYPTFF